MTMGIKHLLLVATTLAVVSGGELGALAKTKTIGQLTQVTVTKHTVAGKTTKNAKVKLVNAHGKKLATGKTSKVGKFKITAKSQNLSKLKFKLTVTKAGYKARTFSNKQIKRAVKRTPTATTVGTVTAGGNSAQVAVHQPSYSSQDVPGVSRPDAFKAKRAEIAAARAKFMQLKGQMQPVLAKIATLTTANAKLLENRAVVEHDLAAAKGRNDQAAIQDATKRINSINAQIISNQKERDAAFFQLKPVDDAGTKLSSLMDEMYSLDKTYVPEDINY